MNDGNYNQLVVKLTIAMFTHTTSKEHVICQYAKILNYTAYIKYS